MLSQSGETINVKRVARIRRQRGLQASRRAGKRRRVAGHANAARGADILWIIGADEKRGIIGIDPIEMSDWTAKLKACFDGPIPRFTDVQIEHNGRVCVALAFDTSMAPYVVKNPTGGGISLEVPWREGTSVRTASRNDLLLMLSDRSVLPDFEMTNAVWHKCHPDENTPDETHIFSLLFSFYVTPRNTPLVRGV